MPSAAAERENPTKFSVRDFGRSICEPAKILREPGTHLGRMPNASNSARVSLANIQSTLLRAPERGQIDSLGHCEGGEVRRLVAFGDRHENQLSDSTHSPQ